METKELGRQVRSDVVEVCKVNLRSQMISQILIISRSGVQSTVRK